MEGLSARAALLVFGQARTLACRRPSADAAPAMLGKGTMNAIFCRLTLAAVLAAATAPSAAQDSRPGVERLYVIDCGQGRSPDQSRWSPGVNVNQPIDMVSNCYLIKHV